MPRYNVEHNGKWAAFSSIVDDFVTGFMDKEQYEAWRIEEYGKSDYRPAEQCNRKTMHEALMTIGIHHGIERIEEINKETGFNLPMDFYRTAIAQALKELDESYPPDPFDDLEERE